MVKFNLRSILIAFVLSLILSSILSFDIVEKNLNAKEVVIDSEDDFEIIPTLRNNDRAIVKATQNNFFTARDLDGKYYFSTNEFKDQLIISVENRAALSSNQFYGKINKISEIDNYEDLIEVLNNPLQDYTGEYSSIPLSDEELEKIKSNFSEDTFVLVPSDRINDQRVILVGEYLFSLLIFSTFLSFIFNGIYFEEED